MSLADDMANRSQSLGEILNANLAPFYSAGYYHTDFVDNWERHTLTPAAMLATLAKRTMNQDVRARLLQQVVDIVTNAIAANTNAAGVFLYLGVPDDTTVIEAAASLSWIINQISVNALAPGVWSSWLNVCKANCDWLDSGGHTTFYINGNFNVHLLTPYALTAQACTNAVEKAHYTDMYERAYTFLLSPVSAGVQWTGYGLVTTVTGVQADWSDYQAYFTETSGYQGQNPFPTFDPAYTMYTLSLLSRLFVVIRDQRLMRLMNALANKIEPLVNTTTWIADCTGGSRQNGPRDFTEGYPHVTALIGNKVMNRGFLDSAVLKSMWDTGISPEILANSTTVNYPENFYPTWDVTISPVREAAALAGGLDPWTPVAKRFSPTKSIDY